MSPVRRRRMNPGARAAIKKAEVEARAKKIGASVVVTPKRAKFNQQKTWYEGELYDSLTEAEFAANLDRQLAAGQIKGWSRPEKMVVFDARRVIDRITYKPDFLIIRVDGTCYYVDVKGSKTTMTQAWSLRVKMWRQVYP